MVNYGSDRGFIFSTDAERCKSFHQFIVNPYHVGCVLFATLPPNFYTSNSHDSLYSKTCVKQSLSKRPKIGFQDQLSLNAG